MDAMILSFELGTFPESGIFLNIGDAGYVDSDREGELVFYLTDTNGGSEVMISKQTAMLLYTDAYFDAKCTKIPWSDQMIYSEDAVANIYDRINRNEPGDDYVEDNESRITGWRTYQPDDPGMTGDDIVGLSDEEYRNLPIEDRSMDAMAPGVIDGCHREHGRMGMSGDC